MKDCISSILFLILLPQLAVLPLLHLQHLLELLRNHIVIHPSVHHVLSKVTVRRQRVFLIQANVVIVLVNIEESLLAQIYKFCPSSPNLTNFT
jgi:hypothetical protein